MDCVLSCYDITKRKKRGWEYIKNYYFKCGRILEYNLPVHVPKKSQVTAYYRGGVKTGWQLKHSLELRRTPKQFLDNGGDPMFDIVISGQIVSVIISEENVVLRHGECQHIINTKLIDVNEWANDIFHHRRGCMAKKI